MRWQEERAVPIPLADSDGGERALEGLFVPPRGDDPRAAVIAPPHPMMGGSMDSPVVSEVSHACSELGMASLRFNWRGVGGSRGEPTGDFDAAADDYRAALRQLAETAEGALVACGYSFGAAAALRVAAEEARVTDLVLVAPPVALIDRQVLGEFAGGIVIVAGEHDRYAPPAAISEAVTDLERVEVHAIPKADHFFAMGLADVGKIVGNYLVRMRSTLG